MLRTTPSWPVLLALLLFLGSGASARADDATAAIPGVSAPDAHDLSADEALAQESHDDGEPPESSAAKDFIYDLRLDLGLTAAGNEPDTVLRSTTVQRPLLGPLVKWQTTDLLKPRERRVYPSVRAAASAEWEAQDWLLFRATLDSGEIRKGDALGLSSGITMNSNDVGDELSSLAFVRELSAVLSTGTASLELGRFRASVGNGLVYDDFSNGARGRVSIGSLRLEALASTLGPAVTRDRRNPLLAVDATYELDYFQTVGVFAALARDNAGQLTDVLRSSLALDRLDRPNALDALFADDRGKGTVGYVGAETQLVLAEGLLARGTVAFCFGQFALQETLPTNLEKTVRDNVRIRGALADAELHYAAGRHIDLSAYAFALSGDGPPQGNGDTYHSFLGLAPHWAWSGLFFSGGLLPGLAPNRSAFAGLHGHGVFGTGPGFEWRNEHLSYDTRVLFLQALADPLATAYGGGSGRTYGVEWDQRVNWNLLAWLQLGAETDALLPGDYFEAHQLAYRALLLVSLVYGG